MDKALLFKPRLPEEDVEIEGVGTVRVRGLSRIEAIHVQAAKGAEQERRILALGMVDPAITEDEAREWQKASAAGEIERVAGRITVLSGLAEDSAKSAYKSDGPESGPGVRDVPGAEAGDDGGEAPGGAE